MLSRIFILLLCFVLTSTNCISLANNANDLSKAISQIQQYNYLKAIDILLKIISKDPNNLQAHLYLAVAYNYQGYLDQAQDQYKWLINSTTNDKVKQQYIRAYNDIESLKKQKALYGTEPQNTAIDVLSSQSNLKQVDDNTKVLDKPSILFFVDPLNVMSKQTIDYYNQIKDKYKNFADLKLINVSATDSSDYTVKYQIHGLTPTVIVLNKEGVIVDKVVQEIDFKSLNTKIVQLLSM